MPIPKTPHLAVDCVLFDENHRVLLITRKNPPFQNHLALPGGFVDIGEKAEDACRRELMEETGIVAQDLSLLGVYSDPSRDPRGHICSVVFVGSSPSADLRAGDDAADAAWTANWRETELAFDHGEILEDAEKFLFGM